MIKTELAGWVSAFKEDTFNKHLQEPIKNINSSTEDHHHLVDRESTK